MLPMDAANGCCQCDLLEPPLAADGPARWTRWNFEECKCDWWEVRERDNGLSSGRWMARWQDGKIVEMQSSGVLYMVLQK